MSVAVDESRLINHFDSFGFNSNVQRDRVVVNYYTYLHSLFMEMPTLDLSDMDRIREIMNKAEQYIDEYKTIIEKINQSSG